MRVAVLAVALLCIAPAVRALPLVASNATEANRVLGVDLTGDVYESSWKCFLSNGVTYGVVRGYHSYGGIDTDAPHSMFNAYNSGFSEVDVYLFPCRSKDATAQVAEMIKYLDSYKPYPKKSEGYSTVWIDIETNPSSGCSWTASSQASNCAYIKSLVGAIESHGKKAGMYTSKTMWTQIAGSSCTSASSVPLWYPHYDNNQACSDFSAFGGWSHPAKKQYSGDTKLCGLDIDRNANC